MFDLFTDLCANIDANNSEKSLNWCQVLIQKLVSVFWLLYNNRPKNPLLCTIYVHGEFLHFVKCMYT